MKTIIRVAKTNLASACLLILVLSESVVWINHAQPSEKEYALANSLISKLKGQSLSQMPEALFEAKRGQVTINIYGLLDELSQNEALRAMKETRWITEDRLRVEVNFFPKREFQETYDEGGRAYRVLKKSVPIRRVKLG